MSTKTIIHSSPAQEAKQTAGCVALVAIAAALSFTYNTVHKLWEHPIRNSDVSLGFKISNYENEGGSSYKQSVPEEYRINIDIDNRSEMILYSVNYTATLRVCRNKAEVGDGCPIVQIIEGQLAPDLPPRSKGAASKELSFGKAGAFQGVPVITVAWGDISGVRP